MPALFGNTLRRLQTTSSPLALCFSVFPSAASFPTCLLGQGWPLDSCENGFCIAKGMLIVHCPPFSLAPNGTINSRLLLLWLVYFQYSSPEHIKPHETWRLFGAKGWLPRGEELRISTYLQQSTADAQCGWVLDYDATITLSGLVSSPGHRCSTKFSPSVSHSQWFASS